MPDTLQRRTLRQVLRDATEDFAAHGFIGPAQLNAWLNAIRAAAEYDIGPESRVDADIRRQLDGVFKKLVEKGQISRYVPEVGRYTLSMVAPQLRAELDRRILASADLIKIHRREAIEKTLQRFQGWSTSIPPGGEGAIDKREVRAHITKSVAQLKFEKRRVEIDQGHKLIANVSDITARHNGAIAMIWHSNWRQPNYDYRVDHKDRDEHVYAIKDSWAMQEGLMHKGAGYLEDMTQPGQEPFCRCFGEYVLSLGRLPDSMLTRKGQKLLADAREKRAA